MSNTEDAGFKVLKQCVKFLGGSLHFFDRWLLNHFDHDLTSEEEALFDEMKGHLDLILFAYRCVRDEDEVCFCPHHSSASTVSDEILVQIGQQGPLFERFSQESASQ